MNILIVSIHIIVCFVLIIVILLQAGRGQGLTGGSFGGNVQSLFGTKASSFLTKVTSICAILFLFTCIGLNILEVQKSRSLFHSTGKQAPLDVEQIKKALEKIKKLDPAAKAKTAAQPEKSVDPKSVATALPSAAKPAEAALAETVKTDTAKAAAPEAPKP